MPTNSIIPIDISYGDINVETNIPTSSNIDYHVLVDNFKQMLNSIENKPATFTTPIEIHSLFLKFCKEKDEFIANTVFDDFEIKFIGDKDIHIICNELKLTKSQTCTVLNGYFSMWDCISNKIKNKSLPAIFDNQSIKLMALFGGQEGFNNQFDELLFIYHAYNTIVAEFMKQASEVLNNASKDLQFSNIYGYGLNIVEWIQNPNTLPPVNYLLSACVCIPLTGIIQILQYLVTSKTFGITPGELAKSFKVAVGHSIGIITATAISCSTDERSFYTNAMNALGIHLLIGAFGQLLYPLNIMDSSIAYKQKNETEGTPGPMVLVKGLDYMNLEDIITGFNNKQRHRNEFVHISVINTPKHIIVSGETTSIVKFVRLLYTVCASPGEDQFCIAYSQRKPVITVKYLTLSAPYHCEFLGDAIDKQHQYALKKGWILNAKDMQIPVRANDDGHDIRKEIDLMRYIFQSVMILPVNWPIVVDYPGITHIVDFGPGETRGFGLLAHQNIEERGISVICASAPISRSSDFGTRADLYKSDISSVVRPPNWIKEYSPDLVRTSFDNKLCISTKMSRLLGKPPVMVAGMTPTTVNEELVASILNAGYHVELACGGIHTRAELNLKVNKLVDSIEPGCGITLNCIYLSQTQWSFQFPEIIKMRRRGIPIEGLCIGGGVPSFDIATEIIGEIRDAGLRHIAFKPGSVESIYSVVDIAKASPDFPVMLQWTGGRGGGHHSFEDFHQPILDIYSAIRKQDNIILVAGSGFGGADDTFPYLTGEWSTCYKRTPMPFDGVLLGSRMMVSKESKAADGVKELIIAAQGVPDCDWEQTYTGSAGGVITIKSEFGEPMHVIANRCSLFWKELDSTVFSAPRKNRLRVILQKRDYIISHLNRDHTRPWFGTMPDGRIVDIRDMTYMEVVERLADLLYIKSEKRWMHPSHGNLFRTILLRIEERFAGVHDNYQYFISETDDFRKQVDYILYTYPDTITQLVSSEDIKYFVGLFKQHGKKPVPFIPVLDEEFETWFKKDTVWQSEDLACVPNQDPQRVLILQGPVAARHSTETNIPAKDILDKIYNNLVDKLLESKYSRNLDGIQSVKYLADDQSTMTLSEHITQNITETEKVFILPADDVLLPDSRTWVGVLAANKLNWIHALLTTPYILDNKSLTPNTIRSLLRPRVRNTVRVALDNNEPKIIEITDRNGSLAVHASINNNTIKIAIYNNIKSRSTSLQLQYMYNPKYSLVPLVKIADPNGDPEVRLFRESIKLGCADTLDTPQIIKGQLCASFENYLIDKDRFMQYLEALGHSIKQFECDSNGEVFIPVDYIFVLAYQLFTDCMTSAHYIRGLLRMVHQSNSITLTPGTRQLRTGDMINITMCIVSVVNTSHGIQMKMKTAIKRDNEGVAEMATVVAINGPHLPAKDTFSLVDEQTMRVVIRRKRDISVLRSKEWFLADKSAINRVSVGSILEFTLQSEYRFKTPSVYSQISTTGKVQLITANHTPVHIGDVDYQSSTSFGNAAIEYLKRVGTPEILPIYFDGGGYPLLIRNVDMSDVIRAPHSNYMYSCVSGDHNPIHTNPYVADYAGLSTTITHGMCTSALSRAYIDYYAASGHHERVVAYEVEFIDFVSPGDSIIPSFDHIGMRDGRMLIKGNTVNQSGNEVLKFNAEVEQPPTAYIFTGQGSQSVGMGMDLYESSDAARSVWDRGNMHFIKNYGVSILDIVKHNPANHTVYFDGQRGYIIRDNYINLIPNVSKSTRRYTFTSPKGLLHMTQFAQPALVLFEMAAFADMKNKGLIQSSSMFAGHSLGEYSALCAIGDVLSLEDILDIVFCRGLLMQQRIRRDKLGQSGYGMVAVNPTRAGADFNEGNLTELVNSIRIYGKELIEIANYNITNNQYVVSGTIQQLKVLSMALDELKQHGYYSTDLANGVVQDSVLQVASEKEKMDKVVLERGFATTPLSDVDVPFHSSILNSIVDSLRQYIHKKFKGTYINYTRLCSRYIPNLIGEPFEVSREYLEKVAGLTGSIDIKNIVNKCIESSQTEIENQRYVAQMLLVELLAFQVAHPVKWISTQSHIVSKAKAERVIEIGPAPVLTNMVKKSLDETSSNIVSLSISTDSDEIYYRSKISVEIDESDRAASNNQPDQKGDNSMPNTDSIKTKKQKQETIPTWSEPINPSISTQPAVPIPDMPLEPLFVIKAIIAQKLKQSISSIPDTKSIGALSKGKSTLQNEILGDLKREFNSNIFDVPEELSLEELASKTTNFTGTFGEYINSRISRLFRSKLPGGFNQSDACNYLKLTYGLGPQRCDAILLLALVSEPQTRIPNKTEALVWLDNTVHEYEVINGSSFVKHNIEYQNTDSVNILTTADVQAIEKAQKSQTQLSKQLIEVYAKNIDIDLRNGDRVAKQLRKERDSLQHSLDKLSYELGVEFINRIDPLFDTLKVRCFDSYWNWVRQDAMTLVYDILTRNIDMDSAETKERLHMLKIRSTPELLEYLSFCITKVESSEETNLTGYYISTINAVYQQCKRSLNILPRYTIYSVPTRPHAFIDDKHNVIYEEIADPNIPTREDYIKKMCSDYGDGLPLVYLQTGTVESTWKYNSSLTDIYLESLSDIYRNGITFSGMHVLITGCGRTSIGEEMLKGLLCGGAKVVATTSNYSRKTVLYFENIYKQYGSRGSELIVVPFNQGSVSDVKKLVSFIYGSSNGSNNGLGWDLDIVIPFAALPNQLGDITTIGSYAELSLRAMLTNIHRLLGEIVSQKIDLGYSSRVTRILLPLSINHGQLGGGGLYSESKIALETLMNRWYSESWSDYMSVIGALIGWTRGTTQMINNSVASERIEKLGTYTFTTPEMAALILCVLRDSLCTGDVLEPVMIDLGGRGVCNKMREVLMGIRSRIIKDGGVRRSIFTDLSWDLDTVSNSRLKYNCEHNNISPRFNYNPQFPKYRTSEDLEHLDYMQGMVNLDKVVVVTGFGEVGPYGNSTTRWEMEAYGEFSLEGCIELAWVMGYIKFISGILKSTGKQYTGWVDSKTGTPIADIDVKARYEKQIIEHTGIRLIEPELHDGYDPNNKTFMRELQIEHDMEPFETNKEEAEHFKLKHGNKVDIWEVDSKTWSVQFLEGAIIMVPKALRFDRTVAGQVPTGWDPVRYGIPERLAEQIDQATCYTIVATVEAFLRSGITDPFELYKYFYVNEIGNTIGSGLGNIHSTTKMYAGRLMENNQVQSDIFQETLINIIPAWINMLLLSSSGPIKPVVGACATTVLSIDAAIETIQCGKAKVVITGSTDDFGEELSYEFAQMGATSNSIDEAMHGRAPSEMSRPCTSTRSGFVESEGSGIAILMSASAAIEMGAPIYGIVALSSIATDKISRSAPAPGQGILTTASESLQAKDSKLLDFNYRKLRLEKHLQIIDQQANEIEDISELEIKSFEAARKAKLDEWGNEFWKNDKSISPLRGALAVWGLDVDDIGVISMHGTSTIANDINESEIFDLQFKHLGRTPGNVVPVIAQKWLTGHPKGPAAAWMLNGVLQVLDTGLIPGNRNADNIDESFKKFKTLVYPSRSSQTFGIKAGLLKSFGFGQAGGELLVVHPDFVLATLSRDELEKYQARVKEREKKVYRYWHDTFVGDHTFVQVKEEPPYTKEQEQNVYLDPTVRARYDPKTNMYHFFDES